MHHAHTALWTAYIGVIIASQFRNLARPEDPYPAFTFTRAQKWVTGTCIVVSLAIALPGGAMPFVDGGEVFLTVGIATASGYLLYLRLCCTNSS